MVDSTITIPEQPKTFKEKLEEKIKELSDSREVSEQNVKELTYVIDGLKKQINI